MTEAVRYTQIVTLEGEGGCGKSALMAKLDQMQSYNGPICLFFLDAIDQLAPDQDLFESRFLPSTILFWVLHETFWPIMKASLKRAEYKTQPLAASKIGSEGNFYWIANFANKPIAIRMTGYAQ